MGPFHLGIDHQNRIWVTNAFGAHVTRFSATDTSKVDRIKAGYSGSGLGIDSQGNVWVTNRLGNAVRGGFDLVDDILVLKGGGNADEALTRQMLKQKGGTDGGSVTLLRPDGTEYPGSPFTGGGLPGPWAVVVDGDDNVWISNFAMPTSPIVQLCGVRTETCPPHEDRRPDFAPRRLRGRGPADADRYRRRSGRQCVGDEQLAGPRELRRSPPEALSTRCGGQGVIIFFGMARPVRAPQIGAGAAILGRARRCVAPDTAFVRSLNMPSNLRLLGAAAAAAALVAAAPAQAEMSAEELAKLAQNPVGNLISVPFQFNTNLRVRHGEEARNTLNIQPVIPVSVNEGVERDYPHDPAGDSHTRLARALGARSASAIWCLRVPFARDPGGWFGGVGPVVQLPTHDNHRTR